MRKSRLRCDGDGDSDSDGDGDGDADASRQPASLIANLIGCAGNAVEGGL